VFNRKEAPPAEPAAAAVPHSFFSLTPERVLDAVERAGHRTTGMCYALNSLENRVYEVELEDNTRIIVKFYRPGRWNKETILDEHRLLSALETEEIAVAAPGKFPDGTTLQINADGIFFAVFPRKGGRSPDELSLDDHAELGRLLARIHNIAASLHLTHRPVLTPQTYGRDCLKQILDHTQISSGLRERYVDAAERLIVIAEASYHDTATQLIHADCHRGNLLRSPQGFLFLDFDDMAVAPPVQDLWLLLPSRPSDCPRELEAMLRGYETFRAFPHESLRLIEILRALRYIRYAGWIATRWTDPSFPRAFPYWGTDNYWQNQLSDLHEQLRVLEEGGP